ncbi:MULTISPECIES: hypothetical protein [Citrobacter freundii complex]|nr:MULTISPECIES: hypothetical protein [Citrobacter freundii complex]
MNGIQKVVDELEAFEQSIRHLPLAGEPAEFGKNRTLRFSGHP